MKNILILLFFCCSTSFFAQETVLLKGKIQADSLMEGTVHIVNLTRETGTINEEDGNFEIAVNLKDTLFFSSVQFEKREIVITSEIFQNKKLVVQLEPKFNELAEVRISNINLTGNLGQDIADIEIINPNDFGLPWPQEPTFTPSERLLYTASSTPVDLIINVLTGRLAMLKMHNENMKKKSLVEEAKFQFPEEFFTEELKIPQTKIENFIFFCAETDPNFKIMVSNNQFLELIEYYKKRIPEFLKMRKGETELLD